MNKVVEDLELRVIEEESFPKPRRLSCSMCMVAVELAVKWPFKAYRTLCSLVCFEKHRESCDFKNIPHLVHFHINEVLSMRNMFKEVKVLKICGALETGFTYASVLLFELHLAIKHSSTSHSPFSRPLLYELLLSIGILLLYEL